MGQREGLSGWRVGTHTGQREAFLSALLSRELIEEDMGLCPFWPYLALLRLLLRQPGT